MPMRNDQSLLMRHRWDKWFWFAFLLAAVLSVIFGFREPVTKRFSGLAEYPAPLSLEIHVWSFSAWFVLVAAQIFLSATNRIKQHRKLGWVLIPLVSVMTTSALLAEFHSKRFYAEMDPYQLNILSSTLTEIACFSVPAALAFVYRNNANIHKRLIFVATAVLATAALRRVYAPLFYEAVEPSLLLSLLVEPFGLYLFFGAAALFDWTTRRRIHPSLLLLAIPSRRNNSNLKPPAKLASVTQMRYDVEQRRFSEGKSCANDAQPAWHHNSLDSHHILRVHGYLWSSRVLAKTRRNSLDIRDFGVDRSGNLTGWPTPTGS